MPGTVLGSFHEWSHSILTMTLLNGYYYAHFTDEKMKPREAKWLVRGVPAKEPWPKSAHLTAIVPLLLVDVSISFVNFIRVVTYSDSDLVLLTLI